jgi:hypothetical protein
MHVPSGGKQNMSPHDEAPDLPSSDNLAPIGVNREQAAAYVGISAGLFDRLVHHGLMPDARMVYGRLMERSGSHGRVQGFAASDGTR